MSGSLTHLNIFTSTAYAKRKLYPRLAGSSKFKTNVQGNVLSFGGNAMITVINFDPKNSAAVDLSQLFFTGSEKGRIILSTGDHQAR